MSQLILKPIIDKNGKLTHVRVKADGKNASARLGGTGAPVSASRADIEVRVPEPSPVAHAGVDESSIFLVKPWDKKPLKHSQFRYEGTVWDLAPQGYSGASCDQCKSFFTDDQFTPTEQGKTNLVQCSVCRRMHSSGQLSSAVRYDDRKFFDKNEVREADWYHITTNPNWHDDILSGDEDEQPLIHAGSIQASDYRADFIKSLSDEDNLSGAEAGSYLHHSVGTNAKLYRYRLRLNPDAPIADTMLPDEDWRAPASPSSDRSGHFADEYELYGATRYVNEFESHGSVSLMMHPSSFVVAERIEIS